MRELVSRHTRCLTPEGAIAPLEAPNNVHSVLDILTSDVAYSDDGSDANPDDLMHHFPEWKPPKKATVKSEGKSKTKTKPKAKSKGHPLYQHLSAMTEEVSTVAGEMLENSAADAQGKSRAVANPYLDLAVFDEGEG